MSRFSLAVSFCLWWMCKSVTDATALPALPGRGRHGRSLASVTTPSEYLSGSDSWKYHQSVVLLRGGGVLIKPVPNRRAVQVQTMLSILLESCGLWGIIFGSGRWATTAAGSGAMGTRVVAGLPKAQWAALGLVLYGSTSVLKVANVLSVGLVNVLSGAAASTSKLSERNQVKRPSQVNKENDWYNKLSKPWFNPPWYAFPIMWLFVCWPTQLMAVSRVLKYSAGSTAMAATTATVTGTTAAAVGVFCTQLALGDAWTDVFFSRQDIQGGKKVMAAFGTVLGASAMAFGRIEASAGYLMLPTVAWVAIAAALNVRIAELNPRK